MLMSGEIPRRHHRTTAHAEDGPSTYIASHDLHTYGEINRLRRQPTAVAIRKLGYDNAHEIAQLCRCRAARGLIHLVEPRRNVSRIALGRHVVDPKRRRSEARPKSFRKPLPMQRHFAFCNMALRPGHRNLPHTYHLSSCVRESGPNIKPSSSSACVRIQHCSRRSCCSSVSAFADFITAFSISGIMRVIE
jgi:hypothetical protein